MRVYGRVTDELGQKSWFAVQTDSSGNSEYVYLSALVQVLKLNLGESPFYGNYGIPAKTSVLQQIAPDYYVAFTQQKYSGYFANLVITRVQNADMVTPTYNVSVLMTTGTKFQVNIDAETVPFPTAPYPVNTILPSLTLMPG
jgi:hypothetical protein